MEAWKKHDDEYAALNANPQNTFTVGHSPISDLLPEEFAALLLPPEVIHTTLAQSLASLEENPCICPEGCGACDCNDFGIGQPDGKLDWRVAASNPSNLTLSTPWPAKGSATAVGHSLLLLRRRLKITSKILLKVLRSIPNSS